MQITSVIATQASSQLNLNQLRRSTLKCQELHKQLSRYTLEMNALKAENRKLGKKNLSLLDKLALSLQEREELMYNMDQQQQQQQGVGNANGNGAEHHHHRELKVPAQRPPHHQGQVQVRKVDGACK